MTEHGKNQRGIANLLVLGCIAVLLIISGVALRSTLELFRTKRSVAADLQRKADEIRLKTQEKAR